MKKLLTTGIAVLAISCAQAQTTLPFDVAEVATFDEPWAMAFLPDGRMLVAEKKGTLQIVGQDGQSSGSVRGVPDVTTADMAAWAMWFCIRTSKKTGLSTSVTLKALSAIRVVQLSLEAC